MAMAVAHSQSAPEPPSHRTELPVPASLDALILDCLAKSPTDRPPTAEMLAQRLESLEDVPAWDRVRARDWWNLHHPDRAVEAPPGCRHLGGQARVAEARVAGSEET